MNSHEMARELLARPAHEMETSYSLEEALDQEPNPKRDQLFVISAINREGIVEELNVYREPGTEIKADDPQLTDEFCQAFADKLCELGRDDDDNPLTEEHIEAEADKFA